MEQRLLLAGEVPARILIVEDDPTLGRIVQRALSGTAETVLARTGRHALAAIAAQPFDLLAVDISLPDISGLEVIAAGRAAAPRSGIVAITGFVDIDVAVRSMKAGADDFLAKPFEGAMLWHVLGKATDHRRQRLAAEQAELYRQLAYTDALTGCPNRRFVDEFIEHAVDRAQREGSPLAVAYVDIDNFKLLNDFLGHDEGDHLLRGVTAALKAAITEPAIFGRFGGDEFVAVFPGSSVAMAQASLATARTAVAALEILSGARATIPARISIGVAAFRGDQTPRDLIAAAEDQMYVDKAFTPTLAQSTGAESAPSLAKVANLKALRNLVKAIDRRDSYTRFHSDHATAIASACGRRLGFGQERMNALTIGGPIHDLGKIVVPDEVLRKPGPMTAEERRTMEEHPIIGAAITAAVTDYEAVVDLVRHHHERFDGRGYPDGLAGEQIRSATRLFTIADAFSAMTTDRPYRRGLATAHALEEISNGRGSQFDPDLAIEFIRTVESASANGPAWAA